MSKTDSKTPVDPARVRGLYIRDSLWTSVLVQAEREERTANRIVIRAIEQYLGKGAS